MPQVPCLRCRALVPVGESYCARHRPSRSSPGRGGGNVTATTGRAMKRDGYRCRVLLPYGSRCPVRSGLEVHHLRALSDGGTHALSNLVTVCARLGHRRLLI